MWTMCKKMKKCNYNQQSAGSTKITKSTKATYDDYHETS